MHEQSRTVPTDTGGARNVYGLGTMLAGQTLPPQQLFEREEYPDIPEAVSAAQLRSFLHGLSGGSHMLPAGAPPSGLWRLLLQRGAK